MRCSEEVEWSFEVKFWKMRILIKFQIMYINARDDTRLSEDSCVNEMIQFTKI